MEGVNGSFRIIWVSGFAYFMPCRWKVKAFLDLGMTRKLWDDWDEVHIGSDIIEN